MKAEDLPEVLSAASNGSSAARTPEELRDQELELLRIREKLEEWNDAVAKAFPGAPGPVAQAC
jgi:hypothetical protein